MSVAAIIVAGGSGSRFGGDKPKQFQMLGGRAVLAHTLEAFNRADIIDEITVAAPADYVAHTWGIVTRYGFGKVRDVVPGGVGRAMSVYKVLKLLPTTTEIVLVHDGVRPFVSEALIKSVAHSARLHGAGVAGVALTDTIKEVSGHGQVVETPDRRRYWRVQTPQGFTYDVIKRAYAQGEKDGILESVTDDSTLVERMGQRVQMVEGHSGNIKITTMEDLLLSEIILRSQS